MNLRDFEYLIAVAEAGTLSAAAQRCGVAQPTLSTQLARLEADLDCTLFERSRRGIRLTRGGEKAVQHARRILEEVQSLRARCRADDQPLSGPFRLGVIPTVGPYLMPSVLAKLRQNYPQLELRLREETTATLLTRLRHGELDAAIVAEPIQHESLHVEPILSESFFAVLPSTHPLAKLPTIDVQTLARQRMLLLEEGHCLREQTARLCQLQSDRTDVQATSVESLRQMVAAGIGVTVLPEMTLQGRWSRFAGTTVVRIKPLTIRRTLVLALRQTHPELGAIRQLAQQIRRWHENPT